MTRVTLLSPPVISVVRVIDINSNISIFPYSVERGGASSRQLLLPVLANRSSAWAPWTNGSERTDKGLLQQLRHKLCFALEICQGGPDYWLPPTLTINLLSCAPHYHPASHSTHLTSLHGPPSTSINNHKNVRRLTAYRGIRCLLLVNQIQF